jgi:VWFA-related protein
MSRLYLKAFLALTLTLLIIAATASPQQEQRPQFRTEVEAVLVDVLVLDDDGYPVRGLTIDDFEIFEDDFPQQIQSFDVVDFAPYVAEAAPKEEEKPTDITPPPAAPVSPPSFPRRFIFIINRQGAQFDFLIRAKEALETFVIESMAEDDEAMVIDISQSTRIVQQFSRSKEEIIRSVKKIPPLRADIFYGTRMATENVYDAFEALGGGLSPIPGRKVVIFMSPTLTKTRDLGSVLREAVASLNTSNTTVYSVNIEGVESRFSTQDDDQRAVEDPDANTVNVDWLELDRTLDADLDSIEYGGLFPLAYETGGRYFINMNVFEPAVERIGRENQQYYLLTYTPTNRATNNRYRRIKVNVKRDDVRVIARKGYFARKRDQSTDETEPDRSTFTATPAPAPTPKTTPEPATQAPAAPATPLPPLKPTQVEITNYLVPAPNGKVQVPIAVALPPNLLADEAGQPEARILTMSLKGSSGAALAQFSDDVDQDNFSVLRTAVLAPGLYRLDITLTNESGMVYETSTQIDVPVGYGDRFGLSTIIPFPITNSEDPNNKTRPSAALRPGQDVLLHFRVFPGKKGEPSKTAELVFSIYQGNQELKSLKYPQVLDLTKNNEFGLQVITSFPMSGMAPGAYRLVVWVSDPDLGRRATGELYLTVVP